MFFSHMLAESISCSNFITEWTLVATLSIQVSWKYMVSGMRGMWQNFTANFAFIQLCSYFQDMHFPYLFCSPYHRFRSTSFCMPTCLKPHLTWKQTQGTLAVKDLLLNSPNIVLAACIKVTKLGSLPALIKKSSNQLSQSLKIKFIPEMFGMSVFPFSIVREWFGPNHANRTP